MIAIETIEQIETEDVEFLRKLDILLNAVSDWDTGVNTIEEYLHGLKLYLGSLDLNKREVLQVLEIKPVFEDAWKGESVATLIQMLDISSDETIATMMEDLLKQIGEFLASQDDGLKFQ